MVGAVLLLELQQPSGDGSRWVRKFGGRRSAPLMYKQLNQSFYLHLELSPAAIVPSFCSSSSKRNQRVVFSLQLEARKNSLYFKCGQKVEQFALNFSF